MHPQSPTFGAEASHSAFCSPPGARYPSRGRCYWERLVSQRIWREGFASYPTSPRLHGRNRNTNKRLGSPVGCPAEAEHPPRARGCREPRKAFFTSTSGLSQPIRYAPLAARGGRMGQRLQLDPNASAAHLPYPPTTGGSDCGDVPHPCYLLWHPKRSVSSAVSLSSFL
jgi:hypothetical protein